MGLSAHRHIHLQRGTTFREISDDGFIIGNSTMRKHPISTKMKPIDWVFSLPGITGSENWFDPLIDSLEGTITGQFSIRETDSPDGDPFKALKWLNAPMSLMRINRLIHSLLSSTSGPCLLNHSISRNLWKIIFQTFSTGSCTSS